MRKSATCTAPGCGSTTPPARCCGTACACSASAHRSGCDMSDGFDELFSEQNAKAPRKRKGVTAIVLGVLAVLLIGLVVWGDGVARGLAEDMVESELADRLPASAGPTEATIGGFAFLPQFFSGTLDELEVNFALSAESIPRLAGDSSTAANLQIAGGVMTHEGAVSFLGIEVG